MTQEREREEFVIADYCDWSKELPNLHGGAIQAAFEAGHRKGQARASRNVLTAEEKVSFAAAVVYARTNKRIPPSLTIELLAIITRLTEK